MIRKDWRTKSPALASFRRPPTAVIAEWQRMRLPMPEESTMGTCSRFPTRSRTPVARASLHLARNSSRLSPRASLPSTSRTAVVPCVFRRVDIAEHDTPFPAICESRRAESALFSIASNTAVGVSAWQLKTTLARDYRSEEHTSELQSLTNLVCRLLLEKKKKKIRYNE